jgi:hypothetical protein
MTRDELASTVNELVDSHKSDRDGGYGLIAELANLKVSFDNEEQRLLREYLLQQVAAQDPRFWGVALEALVRDNSEGIAATLERMVRSGRNDDEWTEQIVLALLRMGHDALDIYVPHIQKLLARGKWACGELSNLYRISPDVSLKMSAEFFVRELSAPPGPRNLDYCLMVFTYNFPRWDENSLARLVAYTRHLDARAADRLRSLLLDFLGKPWVIKDMGIEKQAAVVAHLQKDQIGT